MQFWSLNSCFVDIIPFGSYFSQPTKQTVTTFSKPSNYNTESKSLFRGLISIHSALPNFMFLLTLARTHYLHSHIYPPYFSLYKLEKLCSFFEGYILIDQTFYFTFTFQVLLEIESVYWSRIKECR